MPNVFLLSNLKLFNEQKFAFSNYLQRIWHLHMFINNVMCGRSIQSTVYFTEITFWCWMSSLKLWTTRPLSRGKLMKWQVCWVSPSVNGLVKVIWKFVLCSDEDLPGLKDWSCCMKCGLCLKYVDYPKYKRAVQKSNLIHFICAFVLFAPNWCLSKKFLFLLWSYIYDRILYVEKICLLKIYLLL